MLSILFGPWCAKSLEVYLNSELEFCQPVNKTTISEPSKLFAEKILFSLLPRLRLPVRLIPTTRAKLKGHPRHLRQIRNPRLRRSPQPQPHAIPRRRRRAGPRPAQDPPCTCPPPSTKRAAASSLTAPSPSTPPIPSSPTHSPTLPTGLLQA
jgi:hypothetical protein